MNFYTLASKMNKTIRKKAKEINPFDPNFGNLHKEAIEEARQKAIEEFDRNCELGIELMLRYKEIATEKGLIQGDTKIVRTFMITIRPHCQKTNFETFRQDIQDFQKRKMFEKIYALSFEQKGMSHDTLGHGFHVHIIAQTTCRSKGELLENTYSTFKHYTEKNCIQVDICKNPLEVKQNYLINYISKDGHKAETEKWDTLWRETTNIQPIYEDGEDCLTMRPTIKSISGPQIIELN